MKLLTLMTFFLATSVFAAEFTVTELPVDFIRPFARATFAVNQDLARAWVEIEQHDHTHGSGEAGTVSLWTRAKVNGLSFDQGSSTITLVHDGELIECAKVIRKWYGTRIYNTGCQLETRRVTRTIDDGYNTFKRDFIVVTLKTK
jgi:hypothetical protein